MANNANVNRVEYNGLVVLDLTSDTVDAAHLVTGYTAHARSGEVINGSLTVNTVYSGSSEPTSSIGENGDLYIIIE